MVPRQIADPYSTIYPLASVPFWAALPFSPCGGTTTVDGTPTATICPTGFYCHCNNPGNSICLSTQTAGTPSPTACSPYSGTTTCEQCEFYWQTTLSAMATAFQQCGGYSNGILASAWEQQTLCPVNYRCNPFNFWYEQCLPQTFSMPPLQPFSYWACQSQPFSYATKQGDRCGGHCYTAQSLVGGFCPSAMKCWTQTSSPGYDAYCYSSSPPGGNWATNLCYPIPYDWPGYGAPTCTPQTGAVQTPYGQCYGSTVNPAGTTVPYAGPSNCPCGFSCTTYNPANGACQPIAGFPQSMCNTVGPGTQTMYGRCGGSTYVNGTPYTWSSPTLCQPGATCVTDPGGWYAQCTSIAKHKNRRRSPSPAAAPAALPVANANAMATPAATFGGVYEGARPAFRPRTA
ncbi:hypothetical protein AA313_de0207008 [Arthrobotrys entomopaga]|nr:hypothetical protein AA313_de0207008 [Arthrobotrys entomopaga]